MPRKPTLLPYLQRMKSGRLRFTRRVPPELREYLGNRGYLTVLMPPDLTDPRDKQLLRAWSEASEQVEAEISEARGQYEAKQRAIQAVTALSPRDIAGIAAEPLRQLRNAAAEGQHTQEMEDKAIESLCITLKALVESRLG